MTRLQLIQRGMTVPVSCSRAVELLTLSNLDDQRRFWSKVDVRSDDDCWEWNSERQKSGYPYGTFRISHKAARSHRIAFQIFYGLVSDDLCVLHSCDNPPCCNPRHLFSGTRKDNSRDCASKSRCRWSKLTMDQIRAIQTDPRSTKEVAAAFQISQSHASFLQLKVRAKRNGLNSPLAKLTQEIVDGLKSDNRSCRIIAAELGVSKNAIKYWKRKCASNS